MIISGSYCASLLTCRFELFPHELQSDCGWSPSVQQPKQNRDAGCGHAARTVRSAALSAAQGGGLLSGFEQWIFDRMISCIVFLFPLS